MTTPMRVFCITDFTVVLLGLTDARPILCWFTNYWMLQCTVALKV